MSSRKRIALWSIIVLVTVGLYAWLFGIQTMLTIPTRKIGRDIPIVKSIPAELTDFQASKAAGERLSFKGVELQVPWTPDHARRHKSHCAKRAHTSKRRTDPYSEIG